MENLYLRIEDEIKVKLSKEAKSKGISLNRYVGKSLDEKYRLLVKDIFEIMQNQQNELIHALSENTEVILGLKQMLEE